MEEDEDLMIHVLGLGSGCLFIEVSLDKWIQVYFLQLNLMASSSPLGFLKVMDSKESHKGVGQNPAIHLKPLNISKEHYQSGGLSIIPLTRDRFALFFAFNPNPIEVAL